MLPKHPSILILFARREEGIRPVGCVVFNGLASFVRKRCMVPFFAVENIGSGRRNNSLWRRYRNGTDAIGEPLSTIKAVEEAGISD